MTGTTLITGADGYLGRRIAATLLAGSDDELILAMRAKDRHEFTAKRARLVNELGTHGRTAFVAADVRDEQAFAGIDPTAVTRIVHAAAVIRFNVDKPTARAVNLQGTVRVSAFAARCPRLERLAVLSTLYAAGRRQGAVAERRHTDAGFVNHYEWSKWAAEEHALESDLPVSVLRLPTVIADDARGLVTQYNAFHNTLKLYFYGLLSLVPGDPGTPVSLATASFTAQAVAAMLDPAVPGGIYHVCADPAQTATLGDLIDVVFGVFERDERFRRMGLLRPVYCDQASFEDLADAAGRFRGGPIEESLGSVTPFAPQLYLPKVFGNDGLRAAWPRYAAPDPIELIDATSSYLVATRWGRQLREAV